MSKLELDTIYTEGDKALVTLQLDESGETILHANVVDHYRINIELILLALFVFLLLVYAGWTGIKAVFSFGFTALLNWKVLLPGFLRNVNPVFLSLGIVLVLTGVIVFLVGGTTGKGWLPFSEQRREWW